MQIDCLTNGLSKTDSDYPFVRLTLTNFNVYANNLPLEPQVYRVEMRLANVWLEDLLFGFTTSSTSSDVPSRSHRLLMYSTSSLDPVTAERLSKSTWFGTRHGDGVNSWRRQSGLATQAIREPTNIEQTNDSRQPDRHSGYIRQIDRSNLTRPINSVKTGGPYPGVHGIFRLRIPTDVQSNVLRVVASMPDLTFPSIDKNFPIPSELLTEGLLLIILLTFP
ncbi:unnamed protein product [Protopolystoma xenopodis]|uniref:Uncharacterized protein n=1 Tax=Protopolystoma xenopodis TaxID=117903 RepID=A0A3S5BXY0_9PLAT|nr:unnamed protein product [Protopolystoma xenopodis]